MSDDVKNLMELHLAEYSRRVGHITQPLLMSRIEELEAKLAKAVELLGQWRLASAGHVSLRSVIDKHDATLAELNKERSDEKGQDDA